jgi:hypothetical protein
MLCTTDLNTENSVVTYFMISCRCLEGIENSKEALHYDSLYSGFEHDTLPSFTDYNSLTLVL